MFVSHTAAMQYSIELLSNAQGIKSILIEKVEGTEYELVDAKIYS